MSSEPPRRRYRLFPRTLADCVDPLTKPVFKKRGLASAQIFRHWESIVGPELARQAVPHQIKYPKEKNSDGVLVVHTSGGFATELQHLEPVILEKLATYFGYRAVVRLQIKQVPIATDHTTSPAPSKNPVSSNSIPVEDEVLRGALAKLATALQSGKA